MRMQQRRRTATTWTSGNEVLLDGELGVETDTGKWKFGNGTTAWSALPYQPSTAADAATYAPLVAQRRRDLPGTAGLLTAYPGTAPTVAVGAANASSSITNATHLAPTDARLTVTGALLGNSATFDPATAGPSTLTPFDGNSFQPYRVGLLTDALVTEFQFREVTSNYRVWVDGKPVNLTATALPGGGGFGRITVTFASRTIRRVEVEIDTGHLVEVAIGPTDTIFPALPRKGIRGLIMGDSFVEGTGAASRFTSWAQTFGQLAGWAEIIQSGSGGTGYLSDASPTFSTRKKYRDRFANDVAALTPDIVVFSGGRNDVYFPNTTTASLQTEAGALFAAAKTALPKAAFYVTSIFPAKVWETADPTIGSMNDAIHAAATAAGFPFLDVMGANAYITGMGDVGAPTGTGNADNLTGADAVHPTQLGHDTLARVLFQRYSAALPA